MTYFIQSAAGNGVVYIGTCRPDQAEASRLKLEQESGLPMVLLGTMPDCRMSQREVVSMFSYLRFGRTDRFNPSPGLFGFIRSKCDAPPAAVPT